MTKTYRNNFAISFSLTKTSSCDSVKHDESIMRLASHQQTDFVFFFPSFSHTHTHSHTRIVSLMRYHFVIYHAAQQDVSPPLMHQRQQQFCPCLCSPSRLQQAQCCLALLGSGGGERGRYTINDYTLPHCQTPLRTRLFPYVPPPSLSMA